MKEPPVVPKRRFNRNYKSHHISHTKIFKQLASLREQMGINSQLNSEMQKAIDSKSRDRTLGVLISSPFGSLSRENTLALQSPNPKVP